MGEDTEKVNVRSGERGHVCVCERERMWSIESCGERDEKRKR